MNVCIDTNILIYLANGSLPAEPIRHLNGYYASVTKIESLGYGDLIVNEAMQIVDFLEAYQQLDLDDEIIQQAINIRRIKKISLGDSIIAATALVYDLPLWTANLKDFSGVPGLKLYNPEGAKSD